jgi:transcriptional regulator with XRE-family HTH domain
VTRYDLTETPIRARLARDHLGLTVAEAAVRTGLSASTIRRLERTPGWSRVRALPSIAVGYGVSSDWLMGDGPREPVRWFADDRTADVAALKHVARAALEGAAADGVTPTIAGYLERISDAITARMPAAAVPGDSEDRP